jgi:hypothetical protein
MSPAPSALPGPQPLPSALLRAFDFQAEWCRLPAPFTAQMLRRTRAWLDVDAAAHGALAAVAEDPLAAAAPLRWAGALHHLALRGLAPWAPLWTAVSASDDELDAAIATAWQQQQPHLQAALALPPQTNEVQRSAALLPGLLWVTARTGLPLALLEIGASAGLNLWCERWFHDHGRWHWGDPAAPLALHADWRGDVPSEAGADLQVLERAGCDANPIDLTQPDEGLRLASFIWPDQPERLARLHAARQAAAVWMAQEGLALQRSHALDFVTRQLSAPRPGRATVLMHSVVWQYIDAAERDAIAATVEAAGARATAAAPLAWLRFEPPAGDGHCELRCRLWPDGADHRLAEAHPHVAWLRWLADTQKDRDSDTAAA